MEPFDPTVVYHLRGVPDELIDIDIDTSSVAPLVRTAMLEHRTQWNDMNSPAESDQDRVKNVSRETQVIAWPAERPGRAAGRRLRGAHPHLSQRDASGLTSAP